MVCANKSPRTSATTRDGSIGWREVVICDFFNDQLACCHLRKKNGRITTTVYSIDSAQDIRRLKRDASRECRFVAVLPKSAYLARTVQLPLIDPNQMQEMIRLEAEGLAPAGFGSFEFAHCCKKDDQTDRRRFEIFLARSCEMEVFLSHFQRYGVTPDVILPSQVLWDAILNRTPNIDVLACACGGSGVELACRHAEESILVRSVKGSSTTSRYRQEMTDALVEFLRSTSDENSLNAAQRTIGRLGQDCPEIPLNGDVSVYDVSRDVGIDQRIDIDSKKVSTSSLIAGLLLLDGDLAPIWSTANLLPAGIQSKRDHRLVYQSLMVTAAATITTVLLIYAAIQVAIWRNQSANEEILQKIVVIKDEGALIGSRLKQIELLRDANASRRRFLNLIEGLHHATPLGVTYNKLTLTADGQVRLRGQAASVALPFELPEKLDAQPIFKDVLLQDAGSVQRAGGSLTEFRIDCQLAEDKP